MTTTTIDTRLATMAIAAELIEEVTEGGFRAIAYRLIGRLYVRVRSETTDMNVRFCFEDDTGDLLLYAARQRSGKLGTLRKLHWSGPWDGSLPRWTPEGVAGLVLATIATWPENA